MTNRTAAEWLKIPKDELGVKLAEVLKVSKHNWLEPAVYHGPEDPLGFVKKCQKCGHVYTIAEASIPCPVPDPIKLDWNTAMEWFRKTATDYQERLTGAVVEIFLYEIDDGNGNADRMVGLLKKKQLEANAIAWFTFYAQPHHYLIAAAMAAEGAKE